MELKCIALFINIYCYQYFVQLFSFIYLYNNLLKFIETIICSAQTTARLYLGSMYGKYDKTMQYTLIVFKNYSHRFVIHKKFLLKLYLSKIYISIEFRLPMNEYEYSYILIFF